MNWECVGRFSDFGSSWPALSRACSLQWIAGFVTVTAARQSRILTGFPCAMRHGPRAELNYGVVCPRSASRPRGPGCG